MTAHWPALDYLGWRETCSALHLFTQVVGKYRLAHTPWQNHSWHATLYVTPRGLGTGLIPDGAGTEIRFDFRDHVVRGTGADGRTGSFPLGPTTVAAFHASFVDLVSEIGGSPTFSGAPNEVADPQPFREDDRDRPYDRDAVERFHRALLDIDRVFTTSRSAFLGKSSPSHLFWGSFDMAVTRFSGRRAPRHPGGVPALPDDVAQEAYDREVASAGFWPGGNGIDYPAFYAYAYPAPPGFRSAPVRPEGAFWHETLSEFVLPYDAVRSAADPDATLLAFLNATYEAAADLGGWDRSLLDCAPGQPGLVRTPSPAEPVVAPPAGGEVVREDGPTKGRYLLVIDGAEAELTYSRLGTRQVILDHTEVPASLRGRKVGARLVQQAVEDARRDGITIVPLCPFAKAQISRHPDWQDVLPPA